METETVQSNRLSKDIDPHKMSKAQRQHWAKQWLKDRERGRKDLLWLSNEVLNYRDVDAKVHGPVIAHLQQFRGREEYIDPDSLQLVFSEPRCAIHKAGNDECKMECFGRSQWMLAGARFRMLLDPRGHYKTTISTIAHSIQWILNYENIRIAISVATFDPRGIEIIGEIEDHFRYNEKFRFLYPEFCPAAGVSAWGTQRSFEVPCRRVRHNSPTVSIVSVGAQITGSHFDVIKNSDIVNEVNARTEGGLREVKQHFKHMIPLLERGPEIEGRHSTKGWMDLEDTIYHHSDLCSEELEADEKRMKQGLPCQWSVLRRDGIVDETNYERLKHAHLTGQPVEGILKELGPERVAAITLFPKMFPWREMVDTETRIDDEYTFNCQYRLNPHSRSTGLAERLILFPHSYVKELLPRYRMVKCTVDLASMEEDSDGCNTALCTVGHDRDGRKDVLDAVVGRPNPFEVIDHFFRIDKQFSTGQRKVMFQIEKAHHAQVLLPFLEREQEKRGVRLHVNAIPRDSGRSKDNRIWGLQSWFKRGLIRFADNIRDLAHIEKEVRNFPSYKFKDFLDALSDQTQTKDGDVDYEAVLPDRPKYDEMNPYQAFGLNGKFSGFDPLTKQPVWDSTEDTEAIFGYSGLTGNDSRVASRMNVTGVL